MRQLPNAHLMKYEQRTNASERESFVLAHFSLFILYFSLWFWILFVLFWRVVSLCLQRPVWSLSSSFSLCCFHSNSRSLYTLLLSPKVRVTRALTNSLLQTLTFILVCVWVFQARWYSFNSKYIWKFAENNYHHHSEWRKSEWRNNCTYTSCTRHVHSILTHCWCRFASGGRGVHAPMLFGNKQTLTPFIYIS